MSDRSSFEYSLPHGRLDGMCPTPDQRRQTFRAETLRELLDKRGNRCQSCGVENAALELAHIVPIAEAGGIGLDNVALLCRNCHYLLDSFRPSGLEFERFLSNILVGNHEYGDVVAESPLRSSEGILLRADFVAARQREGKRERVLIEAKAWSSVGGAQVQAAIEQIERYRRVGMFDAAALVFPGRVGEDGKAALEAADIEVWDLDHVAAAFAKEIAAQPPSGFKLLYSLVAHSGGRSQSDALIARLKACKPGTEDWVTYQRVVADVFEFLFVPPLTHHYWESSDARGANRRDIILSNYAADGFWKFLRETYQAYHIVVDAKNRKNKTSKSEALQVANYLKPHGTGKFGIIATRSDASPACRHTIAEQWTLYGKMIVLLKDDDIETMLLSAGSGGKPEDVIGQKIEKFRLSM